MKQTCRILLLLLPVWLASCEKELVVDYDLVPVRQVLICNFYPDQAFQVSLSASKTPDDYTSVNFLEHATVELYENGVFIETLPYVYRDSTLDYGFYTSAYKAKPGNTYTLRTSDAEGLPGVSASEYLPRALPLNSFWLDQHPDSTEPNRKGQLSFQIEDEALQDDYYFASVFYLVKRLRVRDGDSTWVDDYVFNDSPLSAPGYPNPSKFPRVYFSDEKFRGSTTAFSFEFPGVYNSYYKEITLIFELSHIGKNYYDYYSTTVPRNASNINDGSGDPVPEISNIVNGYGHFSAQSSTYVALRIK